MSPFTRITLSVCLASLIGHGIHAQPPANRQAETVPNQAIVTGPSNGWERIQFIGNASFTDRQLRNALLAQPDFLFAAHPNGPETDLGKQAEVLLRSGYRNVGFPHVSITTRRDADVLSCTIDEGPRFHCGSVIINGGSELNTEALIARLSSPYPGPDAFPTYVTNDGADEVRWIDKDGKEKKLEDAVWPADDPVPFDAESKLQVKVRTALRDIGFSSAVTIVRIADDESNQTADLVIDIVTEGPADRIAKITSNGLSRNTHEQLVRFVGVTEGAIFNHELIGRMSKRLWDCGRFTKHQITFDADTETLAFEITETEGLPLLDEPISKEAKAFLAARQWLATVDVRGDDIELLQTKGAIELRAIFSKDGMFTQLSTTQTDPSDGKPQAMTTLADESGLIINHSDHPGKLWIDMSGIKGRLTLSNKVAAAADSKHVYAVSFGFNMKTQRQEGQVFVGHVVDISPAEWLPLAYHDKLQANFDDGVMTARWPGNDEFKREDVVQIDSETGEIQEFDWGSGRVRFKSGLFANEQKRLRNEAASKENLYNSDRALSSLTAYLISPPVWDSIEQVRRQLTKSPTPVQPELIRAARRLVDAGLLSIPDAVFTEFGPRFNKSDRFKIPSENPQGDSMTQIAREIVAKTILHLAPECFTEDGWPLLVTREACLMMLGKGKYVGQTLQQINENPENGPLCHATVARLLALAGSPHASQFAGRSLDKLDANSFTLDYDTLIALRGKERILETLAAFQTLSRPELDALLALSHNESLNQFLELVHSNPLAKPTDAGLIWYEISRASLKASLEKLR